MHAAHLLGETLKEAPAEADARSTTLLLRGGWLRPVGAGGLALLPLGQRALERLEARVRGALEPLDTQPLGLPPEDGEAAVLELARSELKSYRQLPLRLHAVAHRSSPGARARSGLLAPRDAQLLALYSLSIAPDAELEALLAPLEGVLVGLGLQLRRVQAGSAQGRRGLALWSPCAHGEDAAALCPGCGYAARPEVAHPGLEPVPAGEVPPVERVHTPGAKTIEALAGFLGLPRASTGKAVFYAARLPGVDAERLVLALVRGDHEVNPVAVQALLGATALRPAPDEAIRAAGLVPGYGSAVGLAPGRAVVLVDPQVAQAPGLVVGANAEEHHLLHAVCGRDYTADHIAPLAAVWPGAPCPDCGAPLELTRGVELARLLHAGTSPAEAAGVSVTDGQGQRQSPALTLGALDLTRTLGALAERHHDEHGVSLPLDINPAPLALLALARKPEARAAAESVREALRTAGMTPLYDDRDQSPGAKFADCELRGARVRVVVSDRGVAQGAAELRVRGAEARQVPLAEIVALTLAALHETTG